jgi:hypothetical protein
VPLKHVQLEIIWGIPWWKNIKRLLEMDWKVRISHFYRETNQCAEVSANMGCVLDCDIIYFDDCQSRIRISLDVDVML